MHQALHIFRKDVRYLRREIALILLIAFIYGAMHGPDAIQASGWALAAMAAFLIGRVVLAEAIPGDRQFWITRPFRWQGLLGAKLLFIAVFVNLPILLAHLYILIDDRFPLASSLPGLLWSQVLLFAFVALPFAALAALVSGMVPFVFSLLIVFAAAIGISEPLVPSIAARLLGVDWMRGSIVFVVLAAISIPVLLVQYKTRCTLFSRWFALGGMAAGGLAFVVMPWTLPLAAESYLSKASSLGSSMQIALDQRSGQPRWFPALASQVMMSFPIAVSGIPEGTEFQSDALSISLQGPDGRSTRLSALDCPDLRRVTTSAAGATIYAQCSIDPSFFHRERGQPLTLRAAMYFTLFGNARSQTIPLTNEPTNALDGLQCYVDLVKAEWDVYCRSAFRWPARLVYAKLGHTNANSFVQFVSYSPFPASLSIDPVETRWASAYASGPAPNVRDVTIIVEEPLAHLRRDFEARNVRLSQFQSVPAGTVPPR